MQSRSNTRMRVSAPLAKEEKTSHLLYQVATVIAILLFLVSFWSC